jgi:integrase
MLKRAQIHQLIDLIASAEKWEAPQVEKAKRHSMRNIKKPLKEYRERVQKLKLDTVKLTLSDVRPHDLRHSFASFGAAGGLSLFMIGKLLGHKDEGTTARYSHLIGDPMREAANLIGSKISAAMDGKQAEVIPLKRGE